MTRIRPSRVVPMWCAAGGVTQLCVFDGALHLIRKDQLLLNGCSPPERVCCCHPRGEGMGMGSTRALLPVPGPSLFVAEGTL